MRVEEEKAILTLILAILIVASVVVIFSYGSKTVTFTGKVVDEGSNLTSGNASESFSETDNQTQINETANETQEAATEEESSEEAFNESASFMGDSNESVNETSLNESVSNETNETFSSLNESINGTTNETASESYSNESLSNETEEQACVESWSCSDWGECSNGIQERVCEDLNSCGTEFNKPAETRECEESEENLDEEQESLEEEPEISEQQESEDSEGSETQVPLEPPILPHEEKGPSGEEEGESAGSVTGSVINNTLSNVSCEEGCVFEDKCYKIGKRKGKSYCSEEGWKLQKNLGEPCESNFECLSYNCDKGVCEKETWFRKLILWLIKLFVGESGSREGPAVQLVNQSSNQTNSS